MTPEYNADVVQRRIKRLNDAVLHWAKEEDAQILQQRDEESAFLLDGLADEGIHAESIMRMWHGITRIAWRGCRVRRGVFFMGHGTPHLMFENAWWIGYTTAGNGTPAFIFPVNDIITGEIASRLIEQRVI